MKPELTARLEELAREGREHDAARADRDARRRNLEPGTAALLATVVKAAGARRVLEVGTSNGYSTLWLADAVGPDGRVLSVDVDPGRSALAARELADAGLDARVELRVQDAAEALAAGDTSAFDVVFLDGDRRAYPAYWPALERTLRPGGTLAVDNVHSHPDEIAPLLPCVAPWEPVVVDVGAGLLLAVKPPPAR